MPDLRPPRRRAGLKERADLWKSTDAVLRELAATESRVLVADNVKGFRILERSWLAQGRLHSGLVYINSKAYPMNRGRMGTIAAALLARHHANAWPEPGTSDWL